MPIAHLHASFLNANRDNKQRPLSMRDCLIFKPTEEDGHIDDLLLDGDW